MLAPTTSGRLHVRRRRTPLLVLALGALCATLVVACDVTATKATVADAYVDGDGPTVAYGSSGQLIVDAAPQREIFLRFDLSDQENTLVEARLRLHVADTASAGSADGGTVSSVTGAWSEGGITFADRPTTWGLPAAEIGAVTRNTWVEVAIPQAVAIGGVVTIGIRTTSTDGAYYDSRESGPNGPQLLVTTGPARAAVSGPTIAVVGDMACAPGGVVSDTTCHQQAVSDALVADSSVSQLLALGDLQYDVGDLAAFEAAYDPTYGRMKAITKPLPGNHEYNTAGAAGYYAYFGAAAGDPAKGYYSYDIGTTWHVVVLNSNCGAVSCAAGSAQETWLRADLAASTRPCTIAAWHHPRFTSSTGHTNDPAVAPFWDALQADGADIVLNGHVHNYEGFAPQLPDAAPKGTGIRSFIVGTGGKSLYAFAAAQLNSLVRLETFGYLKLTLGASSYAWRFVDEQGRVRDAGSSDCH